MKTLMLNKDKFIVPNKEEKKKKISYHILKSDLLSIMHIIIIKVKITPYGNTNTSNKS